MDNKFQNVRKSIIEISKKLFEEYGYAELNMETISRNCNISLGELKTYFKNKEEIFLQVIKVPHCDSVEQIKRCMDRNISAIQIINLYLDNEKKSLLGKEGCFQMAKYEYYIKLKKEDNEEVINYMFERKFDAISDLLKYGIERDEFNDVDIVKTSKSIIFLLEGLRISSVLSDLEEYEVDEQGELIRELLIKDKLLFKGR